jgi:spermidine synthase
VVVVETAGLGRMLLNDGSVMISERDEFVYHEMIAHVALFVHPDPRRVLIVGGGDGGTAREVLRHPSVSHCRVVEIDAAVVEACKRHIPQTARALDDPRVEVLIEDGLAHVAGTTERYDLVIVDSCDAEGPSEPLFDSGFYANVRRVLNEDGIVVAHAHSPFYNAEEQAALLRMLSESFRRVRIYNYSNLTYPGGLWSFSYAARNDRCPIRDFDPNRVEKSGLDFQYYGADVHRAAFVLPAFQNKQLGNPNRGQV